MKIKAIRVRKAIDRLQAVMVSMPQIDLSKHTQHHFADGMYCRELFRPADTTIVGKVHRKEHLYIVLSGEVTVISDGYRERLKAPRIIVSKPGTKRAVYAHVDSICATVHRTDSRNLDEIEAELIEPDDSAIFDAQNEPKLDVPKFRELTAKVIAAERPGFWSDWTEEQQRLYTAGDWCAFSESRGYSAEDIENYSAWRGMIKGAQDKGLNPYVCIVDLASEAALKNMKLDVKGEILKSSHAPFEPRSERL